MEGLEQGPPGAEGASEGGTLANLVVLVDLSALLCSSEGQRVRKPGSVEEVAPCPAAPTCQAGPSLVTALAGGVSERGWPWQKWNCIEEPCL